MNGRHPYLLLVLARMRELMREPEVVFWVFIFPILLAVGLGVAFRNKATEEIAVGVVEAPEAERVVKALPRPTWPETTARRVFGGRRSRSRVQSP